MRLTGLGCSVGVPERIVQKSNSSDTDVLPAIHATAESLFAGVGGGAAADLDALASFPCVLDTSVVESLVASELASSKAEAKRLIKAGGARINGSKVESDDRALLESDFDEQGRLKLSSGKKKHVVLRLV